MSSSFSLRHVLFLVAATACWGCGTVLSKQVLDRGVAPFTLLVIELAASCLFLLASVRLARERWVWSVPTLQLSLLGLLNPGLAYALGLLGLLTVTASLSVLLWATEPVLIMLLGLMVLRERIAPVTASAVGVALAGVLLVVHRPGAAGDARGIALSVLAVLACATYTVLTRRLPLDDSSVVIVLLQQAMALLFALVMVLVFAAIGAAAVKVPADMNTWGMAAASGIVYYGLAFWLFVSGLRVVPAAVAGSFLPAIPVFGLVAAYLTGDRLAERQWLGAALVVTATAAAATWQLRTQTRQTAGSTP